MGSIQQSQAFPIPLAELPALTPKPPLHKENLLLCVWWTARIFVHFDLLPSGQTITGNLYSQNFDIFHRALQNKEPALVNREGVLLLQDSARPHVVRITENTIIRLRYETLVHPPYSPDRSPNDHRLFMALYSHLRNEVFADNAQLQNGTDIYPRT